VPATAPLQHPDISIQGNIRRGRVQASALLAVVCVISLLIGIGIGVLAGNSRSAPSRQVSPAQYAAVREANIGPLEQALLRLPPDCSGSDRGRCTLSIAYALALTQKFGDELLPAPPCLVQSDIKLRAALSELDRDLDAAAVNDALSRTQLVGVSDLAASGALFASETCAHGTSSSPNAPSASTSSTPQRQQFITFGSGTKVIGADIQAGTYRTRHARPGCYFARLKGFGGSLGDIISNAISNGPVVVTIQASDKGFQSDYCDTWTSDLSQITTGTTSFGEGEFIVGIDITPATYRNAGTKGCYWARLRGFGHSLDDISANGATDAQAVVTIAADDKGFESSNCGTWTRIG
jgi:hypothetical protein